MITWTLKMFIPICRSPEIMHYWIINNLGFLETMQEVPYIIVNGTLACGNKPVEDWKHGDWQSVTDCRNSGKNQNDVDNIEYYSEIWIWSEFYFNENSIFQSRPRCIWWYNVRGIVSACRIWFTHNWDCESSRFAVFYPKERWWWFFRMHLWYDRSIDNECFLRVSPDHSTRVVLYELLMHQVSGIIIAVCFMYCHKTTKKSITVNDFFKPFFLCVEHYALNKFDEMNCGEEWKIAAHVSDKTKKKLDFSAWIVAVLVQSRCRQRRIFN